MNERREQWRCHVHTWNDMHNPCIWCERDRLFKAGEDLAAATEAAINDSEGNDDRLVGDAFANLRSAMVEWWTVTQPRTTEPLTGKP